MGNEVCPTTNTPHIQGYIYSANQISQSTLKEVLPRAHLLKAKGNKKQNIKYCSKEGNYVTNFSKNLLPTKTRRERLLAKYEQVTWRPWQRDLLECIDAEPDSRTVHWFWEEKGNVGKSFLARYIVLKYDAIIAEGKTADISNQMNTWLQANPDKDGPAVVVIDVPRCGMNVVNYHAIEKLKNGLLYSGKYEGGVCVFDPPHVVVFANCAPTCESLSLDRWKINHIYT